MTSRDINGTSFETIEQGSGETVVFVHGSVSDYRTWQTQVDEFATGFRAIAFSRRYHWPNEQIADGADYAMAEQVDDLQQFLRSLDAAPVHLVGNSYGAFLCLLLAMREPQLIRSLVLAEAPAVTLFVDIPPRPQQILKLLMSRPSAAVALIRFVATGLGPETSAAQKDDMETALRLFGTAVVGQEAYQRLSAERLGQVRANLIKEEFLGSGFLPLDAGEVSRVQTPTLLIAGQQSPPLFRHLTNRLHELMPHSERIDIPASSHISHEDNPSAYTTAVRSFIEQHP